MLQTQDTLFVDSPSATRGERTVSAIQQAIEDHLYYSLGTTARSASKADLYTALSLVVRDLLISRWRRTIDAHYDANPKFVYYLSAEYLLGKQLPQNLLYTGTTDVFRKALQARGLDLDEIIALDPEPGLGNGGLGRLAACFIDSLATLNLPAVGYGIRYEYGIFKQTFRDGYQVEQPDEWLLTGYPWEFSQADHLIEVGFGGHTERFTDDLGQPRAQWVPRFKVLGEPFTTLVPGYETETVNTLRLWRARATSEFDFQLFDTGDYVRAVEQRVFSENISKVLYPNDVTPQGERLRLQQQYFFVACSLKDIIRRFHFRNQTWDEFPHKVAIQLNDTHPVIAIPELMRVLVDEQCLEWDRAWHITRNTFGYTNHTLMPEAMECWSVPLFESLLPRHLEIIYEINRRFLDDVRARFPGDDARIARMSIIQEGSVKKVRMAHLAVVGSAAVNGVAELQSKLLRERTLADFGEMYSGRFQNKTNGVTPRRFVKMANPGLADLVTAKIGKGWVNDLERLRELEAFVDDAEFRAEWRRVKQANKQELAAFLHTVTGAPVMADSMFDVMVKRLHEYKRQLLKVMHIITLYHRLKDNPALEIIPRTFVFGAKSAPGYAMAKQIIKLINNVGHTVNTDPDVRGRLCVSFPANFNVTMAQRIYPAADLSEQISLAGKEASGTGNMKFALNGAITIGTLDGANVEIRERVGAENFFLFGLTAEQVLTQQAQGYAPMYYYQTNPVLARVIHGISDGEFSGGDKNLFGAITKSLLERDNFMLFADYEDYINCQDRVGQAYYNPENWTRMSILNTARTGYFSSDRTIRQYAQEIWGIQPIAVAT